MEYIAHRINTVAELRALPGTFGVELDLRDSLDGRIYIQHDPFEPGEDLEDYLREFHHGTMILNVKSERIEYRILELLRSHGISRYFFLDSSFPMIYALTSAGERNVAVRLSELEGMDTARNMAGKAGWIWIDCFTRFPVGRAECDELRTMGYRLCLVSPDIVGRGEEIERYARGLRENGIVLDAVCTRSYNAKRWEAAGFDHGIP